MPCSVTYDESMQAVVVVLTGRIDLQSIREAACEVALVCRERGCKRILNDASAADTRDLTFMNIYNSPKVLEECGILIKTQRALVVPADFEETQFLEDVTCNRGHNLKVFQSIEEARIWLCSSNVFPNSEST